jgi:hypothetical protein
LRYPPGPEHDSPTPSPGDRPPVPQAALPNQIPGPQYLSSNERAPSSRPSTSIGSQPQLKTPRSSIALARSLKNDSGSRSITAPNARDKISYASKSTGGTEFTSEEIDLLDQASDDIMNLDENQTINAWLTWASVVSFMLSLFHYLS